MIDHMIQAISSHLNIARGSCESLENWKRRVLYSNIGLQMLASAYDFNDDSMYDSDVPQNTVSMQHVLKRGRRLEDVFCSDLGSPNGDISEYIQQIYVRTGCLLHKANRLAYPNATVAVADNVCVARGIPPWEVKYMSGLGVLADNKSVNISAFDMYHIKKVNVLNWFDELEKNLPWQKTDSLPIHVEYLNIFEEANRGYWGCKPPSEGVTLCRTVGEREKEYRLLRISRAVEQAFLPSWQTEQEEYLRIALALRVRAGNVPHATIQRDGKIVYITISYRLPYAERNFFELYSWPQESLSSWKRIVSDTLLPTFLRMLSYMGFSTQEVEEV
jgi:hypothetical protein